MSKAKVIQYQDRCMGCGACAGIAPTVFTMGGGNGKSVLIDGQEVADASEKTFEREVESNPMIDMLEGICPAGAIKLEKAE
ncbi:MAG: ferredoxin [Pseudomonadales bacterium]|jgi:ferredoxin|nr:ferredoxin [Pseudomonadales bacterium]